MIFLFSRDIIDYVEFIIQFSRRNQTKSRKMAIVSRQRFSIPDVFLLHDVPYA